MKTTYFIPHSLLNNYIVFLSAFFFSSFLFISNPMVVNGLINVKLVVHDNSWMIGECEWLECVKDGSCMQNMKGRRRVHIEMG